MQTLFSGNAVFVEEMYERYLLNPSAVSEDWREYFASFGNDSSNMKRKSWVIDNYALNSNIKQTQNAQSHETNRLFLDRFADLDPLGIYKPDVAADAVNKAYCGKIAVEFSHISCQTKQDWLYSEFEKLTSMHFDQTTQKAFIDHLVASETFEEYVHTKFPGAKRFSIEGGEAALLAVSQAIDLVCDEISQVVIGMSHRGRLSCLAQILHKPYRNIFNEFKGGNYNTQYDGDVKYHNGYDSVQKDGKLEVSLCYNPSHLESINPIVCGRVKALHDQGQKAIGIIIHGDAAFCGQGVVAESIAMSSLPAYDCNGIIHIVVNNQIGFTADAHQTRSGRYPTNFAKIADIPIIHVNGESIEDVVRAIRLASDYKKKFASDVVLDVFCYRKYGHNEGDEPAYTQGPMYKIISNKKTPCDLYASSINMQDYYAKSKSEFKKFLDSEFDAESVVNEQKKHVQQSALKELNKKDLIDLAHKAFDCGVVDVNPKLAKLLEARKQSVTNDQALDWGTVEVIAFGTLLLSGFNVRLSGQDVERGTFSHRHSVLRSQTTDACHIPLNHVAPNQGVYKAYNSLLSEFAVLGFEYGYALDSPNTLTIWEAQFGDFANGAQIIFDQYISSAHAKWKICNNLAVLLPHGYEGQGPEHSSARLERFLQLCAKDNMYVCVPSVPASIFHILRRQAIADKPLIALTPKSLLRHKLAVSKIDDLTADFSEVIFTAPKSKASKFVMCCGKVYYDIYEAIERNNISDVGVIRLEQLYPFPLEQIMSIINSSSDAKIVWCQEEPRNMGAWSFIREKMPNTLCVSRPEASSPAVGYLSVHNAQQELLIKTLLEA